MNLRNERAGDEPAQHGHELVGKWFEVADDFGLKFHRNLVAHRKSLAQRFAAAALRHRRDTQTGQTCGDRCLQWFGSAVIEARPLSLTRAPSLPQIAGSESEIGLRYQCPEEHQNPQSRYADHCRRS